MTPALSICVFALAVAQGNAQTVHQNLEDGSALIQDRVSYAEPLPSDWPFGKRSKRKGTDEAQSHIMEQKPVAAPEPAVTEQRKLAAKANAEPAEETEVVVKPKKESDWMYSKEVRAAQTSLSNLRSLNELLKGMTGLTHTKDVMPKLRSAFKSKTFLDSLLSIAYAIQKSATKLDFFTRKDGEKLWKDVTSTATESDALEAFKKFFVRQTTVEKETAEAYAHHFEALSDSLPEAIPKEAWQALPNGCRAEAWGYGQLYTDLFEATDIDGWCKKLVLVVGNVTARSARNENALKETALAAKELPVVSKAVSDSSPDAEKAAVEAVQAFHELYTHQIAANKELVKWVSQSAKRMFQCELGA